MDEDNRALEGWVGKMTIIAHLVAMVVSAYSARGVDRRRAE
jgi:hypothetical protein